MVEPERREAVKSDFKGSKESKMTSPFEDPEFVLHRHFIWTNEMMLAFKSLALSKTQGLGVEFSADWLRANMYMSLWYGTLQVVVEGWHALKLQDSAIDALLATKTGRKLPDKRDRDETYSDLLQAARNSAFHFQPTYIEKRLDKFMAQPKAAAWVQRLHAEFDRWFLAWLEVRKAKQAR